LDSSDCFRPPQVSPDSSVSLFFILATQPSIGFTTFIAPHLRQAFDDLVATSCHAAAHAAEQTRVWVELWEDATEEELIDLVEAYPEEAWWHGEGSGRLKWVRQMKNYARCWEWLEDARAPDTEPFDWVMLLRPDLLHFRPVPPLQRLALSALPSGLMIFPDGGLRLAPHVGYLEGLDRLLAMTGDVARAFLLEPLLALANRSFVTLHPSCLSCSGWRSPGAARSDAWCAQNPWERSC
ncbi:unnamed protein product, partial [Durusdinium trenchii]